MITEVQEVKETIGFISKVLKAINNHAKVHNIDLVYNGFSDELHIYEERLLNITNKIKDVTESASIEQYTCINKEAIGMNILFIWIVIIFIVLKKELDLSELMHNFLKYRFQIALDQSIDNPSEYSINK